MLMKDLRQGVCAVCGHNQVIEAPACDFTEGRPIQAAASVTHRGSGRVVRAFATSGAGELWLYICPKCGFTQHFTREVEKIPIGEDHLTRIIEGPEPGKGGPYR